jgi:hypothetical protein
MQPGDSLEAFKQGFANARFRLYTHELICNPDVYAHLSEGGPHAGYFPAYRAPRR